MIGQRLKELRSKNKSRQEDIAKAIGISRARYSHYENEIREPDNETLKLLANYFGVTVDYLLGQLDEPNPEKDTIKAVELTPKEESDILRDLQKILDGLEGGYAGFDGKTPEEVEDQELLKVSLEQSMRLAKRLAKEKFTPKKHK